MFVCYNLYYYYYFSITKKMTEECIFKFLILLFIINKVKLLLIYLFIYCPVHVIKLFFTKKMGARRHPM